MRTRLSSIFILALSAGFCPTFHLSGVKLDPFRTPKSSTAVSQRSAAQTIGFTSVSLGGWVGCLGVSLGVWVGCLGVSFGGWVGCLGVSLGMSLGVPTDPDTRPRRR